MKAKRHIGHYIFTAELDVSPDSARNLENFVGAVKEKLRIEEKKYSPQEKLTASRL